MTTPRGTTTPFAALDVATGAMIWKCSRRHRASELLDFLNEIEAAEPKLGLEPHLLEREARMMHNYATHKREKVRNWLDRCRHWHAHVTPTSASWMNAVGGFFSKLSRPITALVRRL